MTAGAILVAISLFLLVGIYVARPFLQPMPKQPRRRSTTEYLEREKEAVLEKIEKLQFDFETHKITEADLMTQRTQFVHEAAKILRQIDKAKDKSTSKQRKNAGGVDAEIEAAIAALRKTSRCPECQAAIANDDSFCPKCGTPLNA